MKERVLTVIGGASFMTALLCMAGVDSPNGWILGIVAVVMLMVTVIIANAVEAEAAEEGGESMNERKVFLSRISAMVWKQRSGLTISQIANALGVKQQVMRNRLAGSSGMPYSEAERLADLLGTTVDALTREIEL